MHFRLRLAQFVVLLASFAVVPLASLPADEDSVFSGPQVGEKIPPFKARGIFDDDAGKTLDFVTQAGGKPIVLIFVHDVNRQSIGMTRILSQYTLSRAADGLHTGIVWLEDDVTSAENTLKRIRHALTPGVPTAVSLDGREGPGSYGLNRNVMLTILVGKEGRVTANHALIQPSLQADLPKILDSIVAVAGGKAPALSELPGMPGRMEAASKPDSAPNLRPLLAPLIRRDATDEMVDQAAKAIKARIAEDAEARREVGRIARTIVDSGKLSNYGTARAQNYLRQWAREIGGTESKSEKPANTEPANTESDKPATKPDPAPRDEGESR